eukprot:2835185-Alexandrium_andersonii.AAC.1
MSASLVGSEMCIRDRHNPSAACRGATPARQRAHRKCRMHRQVAPQVPVSYTHLTLPTICSV